MKLASAKNPKSLSKLKFFVYLSIVVCWLLFDYYIWTPRLGTKIVGTIISIDPECQKYSKGLCVAQIQDSVGKIYEIDYGGENFCQLGATDRAPTIFHGKIDPQIFQANVGDTLEIFARLNIVTKTVNRFSTCWRVPGYYLNILKN